MADFYTIIALVLSVTGATYTAIAGLHHFFNETVDNEWSERVRIAHEVCNECGTDITKASAKRCKKWFKWYQWIWVLTLAVPVIVFCAYAFHTAYIACARCSGRTSDPNILALVEGDMANQVLWLHYLTWIDGTCIILALLMLAFMGGVVWRVATHQTQAEEIKARDTNGT